MCLNFIISSRHPYDSTEAVGLYLYPTVMLFSQIQVSKVMDSAVEVAANIQFIANSPLCNPFS